MVPSSTQNLTKYFTCMPEMQRQIPRLKSIFSKIFRENSIRMRFDFFSDELIRLLWPTYVAE